MALRNIIASRQQVLNTQGVPLVGLVFLYEPGTTTFITSFRDSGLVTPHANPIRLSGSGRANIWISRDCDLRVTDRVNGPLLEGNLVLEELNANPDALGVSASGGLIPNGSFEIDADLDTVPDGWTLASEAGSTNAIDTAESTDGRQSFRFTSSGVGGGSLVTTEFFPVNDIDDLAVNFDLRSTVAAVRNIARIEWYDVSQVFISNSDVYDSTANPTSFTSQNLLATPPALARFAKFRLIGIDPSVALAGSTFFDRCAVFYPAVVSGVFDNITIQNNEIISTNTNGDINLTPNGTGRIVATQLSAVETMRMRADIVTPTPPIGNAVNARYEIYDLDEDDLLADWGFLSASGGVMQLRNRFHGGIVQIRGEDITGAERLLFSANPDGESAMRYDGSERIVALDAGLMAVQSTGNVDTETRQLVFSHQNATQRGFVGHLASDLLTLRNEIHGGIVQIQAEDASGLVRTGFSLDPDGRAVIVHPLTASSQVESNDHTAADSTSGALIRGADGVLHGIGYNEWPRQLISGGNLTLIQAHIGKLLFYNEAAARSLLLNDDSNIAVDTVFRVLVGESSGVLTGDGGAGVTITHFDGVTWVTTAAAGNITIGEGLNEIWKDTDIHYYIVGPNLS